MSKLVIGALFMLISVINGAASSIMLDGQGLSEHAGFQHDENGSLVIIAYYPESGSLGIEKPDNSVAPVVMIQNWYGMDTEIFNIRMTVITNESGITKQYNSTWYVAHISSGRATGLADEKLKGHKYDVVAIKVSYTGQNGDRITDTWKLPTGSLDNKLLDNVHLLRRTPTTDKDNNHVYDVNNGGEVIRFSVL